VSLSAGSKLGPYEITGPLGAGGMGEVYRAKDTRLGRDVAVKILPAHLSDNSEVRERFEREARAISSLNHPHICTLFDVGRDGQADYFVMELLEGESLSTRLERGPMKLDEALKVGAQIADGLAAAHRQGLVHRDLKPGNVVLTKAGAKILDFGVAKLKEEQVVDMATRTTPLTSHGAMVGTVQYMAPEQLEGRPVDHRADLFAFGALLYEMITGQRAFAGKSQASVIAAILTSEPRPASELVPALPPALDRVIKSCLAKEPDERWHSAGDLARELRWIGEGKASPAPVAAAKNGMKGRELVAWGLAGILLATAVIVALRPRPGTAVVKRTTKFSVTPANGQIDGAPVISPDGRSIVFSLSPESGSPGLWLHSLDTGEARSLPGTEGARQPFWSPDGKSIAFFAQGRLKKTGLTGEPPVRLCDAPDTRGGSWSEAGDILFCANSASGLFRVGAAGGSPTAVTTPDTAAGEQSHRMPWFLPDGRHFLYTVTGSERSGVWWGSLDGAPSKRLLPDVTAAKYDPRGYILFRRGGALMAQRFDTDHGELRGDALVAAADVGTDGQITAFDQYSISSGGVLVYRTGVSQKLRLTWTDRAGAASGLAAPEHNLFEPALSPDETRLAVGGAPAGGGDPAIWLLDLAPGGQLSRLTFGKREPETAIWSRDGRFVYYTQNDPGGWSIVRKASDGTGAEESVFSGKYPVWGGSVSPDGRFLVVEQYPPESGGDLWLLPLDGSRTLQPYRQSSSNETHASFSPDGRYLAYSSDEQGTAEVFIETVPPSGSRWQVSSGGGDQACWRADGKALYYVNANRMLVEVDVKGLSPFVMGAQRPLFRLSIPTLLLTGPRTFYAATRNGERFIVNTLVGDRGAPGFEVVLDWDAALGAK
jgi:serine/threonine protein kinase